MEARRKGKGEIKSGRRREKRGKRDQREIGKNGQSRRGKVSGKAGPQVGTCFFPLGLRLGTLIFFPLHFPFSFLFFLLNLIFVDIPFVLFVEQAVDDYQPNLPE